MNGIAYVVFEDKDISELPPPSWRIVFAPARKTIIWRGRKFNIKSAKIVSIDASTERHRESST